MKTRIANLTQVAKRFATLAALVPPPRELEPRALAKQVRADLVDERVRLLEGRGKRHPVRGLRAHAAREPVQQ